MARNDLSYQWMYDAYAGRAAWAPLKPVPGERFRTTARVFVLLWLLALVAGAAGLLSGCATVSGDHRAADRSFYDAIGDEYVRYVKADAAMGEDAKERRYRTVRVWDRHTSPTATAERER